MSDEEGDESQAGRSVQGAGRKDKQVVGGQPLEYRIPEGYDADKEIEKLLQDPELWHDSDVDDTDDYLAAILGSSNDKNSLAFKIEALQSTMLDKQDEATSSEEVDTLLQQYRGEAALEQEFESKNKACDDDIERRLLALKMKPLASASEESENKLFGQIPKAIQADELYNELEDWCCICNEDATVVCSGCEEDKYCSECFLQGHQGPHADYEFKQHKARQYQARSA